MNLNKYLISLMVVCLFVGRSHASLLNGTNTFPKYLIILVHGVGGNNANWTDKTYSEIKITDINDINNYNTYGGLKKHLEKPVVEGGLGLKGYVYAYTFSAPCGSAVYNARELGDRNYYNPAPEMGGLCWLEKAKVDFKNNFKKVIGREPSTLEVPNKYIIVAHSFGNFAPRGYVYSDQLRQFYSTGYYSNDVDKVVFVDAALNGSTNAYVPYLTMYGIVSSASDKLNEFMNGKTRNMAESAPEVLKGEIGKYIQDQLLGGDIFGPYQLAADLSGAMITLPTAADAWFGLKAPGTAWGGLYDTVPLGNTVRAFGSVSPLDISIEPSYSIVYGMGIPVFEPYGTGLSEISKLLVENKIISNNILDQYIGLNYQKRTIFHPSFYGLSTSQAKFMSLQFARFMSGFYTNDGDMVIDAPSQKGEGLLFLKNAPRHGKNFKSENFERFLNNDFPVIVGACEAAIAASAAIVAMGGVPYPVAYQSFWYFRYVPAAALVAQASINSNEINYSVNAHFNVLKEYDLLSTALLDSVAIFEVNDLQTPTVAFGEGGGSPEATALVFSAGVPVPSGFESVKIRSVSENRSAAGFTSMPVPMTLKALTASATAEGERKYVTQMTVTKAPKRIAGKLNYLIPSKMKAFEYSFNFAAWKPIENVDPETGEFVIDDLPFAEGQNVIAVRAENAVGVKSNQLIKIILNTIPLLPTAFVPMPNYYVKDNAPLVSVEFNKSEYTGDYDSEKINIKEMTIDGVSVAPQIESRMNNYHPWAKASYQVPADAPLSEGEHQVAVKAESNVGVSQGLWSFYIDRSPPQISFEAPAPYNTASPTTIRFTASDQLSPNLRDVSCDLYDQAGRFVANIGTAESLSKGDGFFNWDGSGLKGRDGVYRIKLKASDLAGNTAIAEQPFVIDSTPPTVTGIDISPAPMTAKETELAITTRASERSTVIINLKNTDKNSTTGYVSQAEPAPDGNGCLSLYKLKYDDLFSQGPEDGIYRVEVSARDGAGNVSAPRTVEGVVIDRTPPRIYGAVTNPYVLSNIGQNAYQTTLSYQLAEAEKVRIKVYNTNTGQLVETIDNAPCANSANNELLWYGGDPRYPKGAYRLQIIAEDKYGNIGIAYASCVKDGIAPEITYPLEDNAEVAGTISIRGTAVDPDWTNDRPFKDYRVYYRKTGGDWQSEFIEVPQVNRDPRGARNVSVRPLQNNSTLAYLYTNALANGEYTIKVVVNEDGGESPTATRVINVNNDQLTAAAVENPYIKLKPLPNSVEFKTDESVKLPLGFINSVKPANVYVEVVKTGTVETPVYYKYFPNILGAPFIGKPAYNPGSDLGYFIWSDDDGYHLRWSADGRNHRFTGNIILAGSGSYTDIKQYGGGIRVQAPLISWDSLLTGGEGGVDFKVASGQLMITAKIDEDPANPSINAENVYLGVARQSQQYLPVIIDVAGQRLVNVTSMGQAAAPANLERAAQTIDWDGKLDTGAYPDSGIYIVRVRAEGIDGRGVATDEAQVELRTPFEVTNLKVDPADRRFSTLGGIDRVSIFYNVSKDALITANVYDSGDKYVATLADGIEVLGSTNPNNPHSLVWRGNFPDPDSTAVVTGGVYKIKLNIAARDGLASENREIGDITLTRYDANDQVASLEEIGEPVDYDDGTGLKSIRLAAGDSPYYFTAKGSGSYHPEKSFRYTLIATGEQCLTAYPYVPFAGLMHRGFRSVDLQVDITAKVYYTKYGYVLLQGWKGEGQVKTASHTEKFSLNIQDPNYEASYKYDILQFHDAALRGIGEPEGHIDRIDYTLIFRPRRDPTWTLDIVTIEAAAGVNRGLTQPVSGVTIASNKGMFKVSPVWNTWRDNFGRDPLCSLGIALESSIPYSRLTNRFVPWVGFINAKTPSSERTKDFSEFLTDIDKGLGFPGRLFFDDPLAKPGAAGKSTEEVVREFAGLNWAEQKRRLDNLAREANLLGYRDSLASAFGYDTYLSDEVMEFLPITKPLGPEGQPREFEKISDLAYRATTDLVWRPNSTPISPIVERWPLRKTKAQIESEWNSNKSLADWRRDLSAWTGFSNKGQTYFELDEAEISSRESQNANSQTFSSPGQLTVYDKAKGYGWWRSEKPAGELFTLPAFVKNGSYSVVSATDNISVSLVTGGKVYAEDNDRQGSRWTTADDNTLIPSNGSIKSPGLTFNEKEFLGRREVKISDFYDVKEGARSGPPLKYTFVSQDPWGRTYSSPIDNPNVVINSWDVTLADRTGASNNDLILEKIDTTAEKDWQAHYQNDKLKLKLKLGAAEARYVEIRGTVKDARGYELLYFDGKTWKTICQSNEPKTGCLAWWNVSRLNGKYTVLLRTNGGNYIATRDVSIGTLIRKDASGEAYSAYKRAQLKFPKGSFVNGLKLPQDQLVTITPVAMNEIYIRNRPIIITSGPVVEVKPSPWKFTVSTVEGVDQRPTLKFIYTFDDLAELGVNTSSVRNVMGEVARELMLPWNIHQVTAGGDLQIVSDNHQTVEDNNGEKQYVFYAALDHFSTYALLPGKFSLSAPMVFADRYLTNKNTATIYGTAEPGSIVTLYVKEENVVPDTERGELYQGRVTAEAATGSFRFENIALPREGNNYIFVTSHLEADKSIRTCSDLTVVKDTVPPSVEASQSLYAFSPNGDGRYDTVDCLVKSNERGKLCFSVGSTQYAVSSSLANMEISAEAEKDVKISWTKDGFVISRRDSSTGAFTAYSLAPTAYSPADGVYNTTVYAIDEAGNISNNVINQIIVDTRPPVILGLNADPNPFTPNDDGVRDTTRFWYKFSEPAYVSQSIYRDDGNLFRSHEGPTENFVYPTIDRNRDVQSQVPSTGSWTWDGRGSRNELIGGAYSWEVRAEDNVGNRVTSEVRSVIVDRLPTLIPYAYAEPDPFAPVNPANNFTEIKYYLGRDNLKVNAWIAGAEGKTIKTLVANELQTKGEHAVRWYGDFQSDYDGPTASANKYRVADSSYEFKVRAEDPNEPGALPAESANTVLVDNVPPNILVKNLTVDYLNKKAQLTYSIPENSSVEVAVYDREGAPLETVLPDQGQTAGEHTVSYLISGEGERYFRIVARDRARNCAEQRTEAFAVRPDTFRLAGHQAAPAVFTPNGDGLSDITRISYSLAGGVADYQVNINVLNQTGSTVKTLVTNDPQSNGSYSFYWDGKNDAGQPAPDGYYEYSINAEDKLGARVAGRGPLLLVATKPSVSLSVNPAIFSPNGDGAGDKTIFNYAVNYATFYITGEALVKIEVLNASGEAVWSKTFNHVAGSYAYEYDGKANDGTALPAGDYFVRVSGQDVLLSTAVPVTANITFDYSSPVVSVLSAGPTPFSPLPNGVNDQTIINYSLAKPAYVTVKVKQGETTVRTLQSDRWTEAYTPAGSAAKKVRTSAVPAVVWDGKDDLGGFAADGEYLVQISSVDPAGNSSTAASNVVVDNNQPATPQLDPLPEHTNQGRQSVIGSAEPNSLVTVYVNDRSLSSGSAGGDGLFSVPTNMFAGTNEVKVTATDAAGNTSGASAVRSVYYETDAPIISGVEISPNPAKAGPVTIKFSVSETLESEPIVKVNNAAASFSRQFAAPDGVGYEYAYGITAADRQGAAAVVIEARDLAGNVSTYETSSSLTIDTVNSTVGNVDVDIEGNPKGSSQTAYARLGSKVTVAFTVSERLLKDPEVTVGDKAATRESKTVYSVDRVDYSYAYAVTGADPDGTTSVSLEVTDLAGNVTRGTYNQLVVDKITPEVGSFSVSPNPASTPEVSGQVSVKFTVSEPLKSAPRVFLTQYRAVPQLLVTSGQWQTANGLCEAKYSAIAGYEGPALITVEVADLANNRSIYLSNNLLTIDTIKPVFSAVSSEVSGNEYSKFAKEGAEVAISFKSSEPLKLNPEVRVNGNAAVYDSLNAGEYVYKYTVLNNEAEGNADITIAGYDFAGNLGAAETASSAESFVVDLSNPTVAIAPPNTTGEYISYPESFATNANPDGTDRPRSTTFYYNLAEPSKVSVAVYKVSDAQVIYAKSDFSSGNLVKTLVSDVWQAAGKQTITWEGTVTDNLASYDANNDGYARPGKYAFIVEGRDRAGNLTLKKWGGTVWIQDNVLTLKEPEQYLNKNPDPRYISPNGNSADPAQKRARFYFSVPLSLDPASGVPQPPERIEALTLAGAETKKIGQYSVKVYGDPGLTALVRTITSEADAWADSLMYEDWNGKNDAGQFVADGTYYLAVDVKDFAGNGAVDNLLKRPVVVDNTAPTVSGLAVNNYYFSAGKLLGADPARQTTNISYEVGDNNALLYTTIAILRGGAQKAVLQNMATQDANSKYNRLWSGEGYDVDGTYAYRITTVDLAGNWATAEGTAVLDQTGPVGTVKVNNDSTYATSPAVTLGLTYSDAISGMDKMSFSNDGTNWSAWESPADTKNWMLPGPDGNKIVYVKYLDRAGNYSGNNDSIVLDTTPPIGTVVIDGGAAYTNSNSVTLNLSATDALGEVAQMRLSNDNSNWTTCDYVNSYFWYLPSGDGVKRVYVQFKDSAGNWSGSFSGTIGLDQTAPTVTFGGQAADAWYSADNTITISLSDNLSYRGYKWAWDSWPADDPAGCQTETSNKTTHGSQGPRKLYVRVWDWAGNESTYSKNYYRDYTVPTVTFGGQAADTWYSADNTISISLSDNLCYRGYKWSWDSWPADDPAGCQTETSNTTTHGGQGAKTLYVRAWDWAGNENTYSKTYYRDSVPPSAWLGLPEYTNSTDITVNIYDPYDAQSGISEMRVSNNRNDMGSPRPFSNSFQWTIDKKDGYNVVYVQLKDNTGNWSDVICRGIYLYSEGPKTVKAGPAYISYGMFGTYAIDSWGDSQAEKDASTISLPYGMRVSFNCQSTSGASYTYAIAKKSNDSYAWSTVESSSSKTVPVDLYSGDYYIYIAPASFGSGQGVAEVTITGEPGHFVHALSASAPLITSSAMTVPVLVAPTKDQQNVSSIRPTFEWQHRRPVTSNQQLVTGYQIDVAKNDTFSIAAQTFSKASGAGTADLADPALYHYTYAIHEFDPGLDRDTYYWKVTALTTNEAATSEVWSFKIAPELTLTGVTNYPNPFNPNREKTKIRYRLSTDASEAKIRIYDITGSLVNELDGTTNGESVNIWSKYNDIEWDGRNGRGDVVVNGIYPFEVVARLGDKSVSGRGKIAVLK